jgi:large-conductance mechanosensitive channel
VVVGAAASGFVTALVKDTLTPLIAAICAGDISVKAGGVARFARQY